MRFYESLYVLLQCQAIIFYFVIGRDERVKVTGNQDVVKNHKSVSLVMKNDTNAVDNLRSL